MSRNNRNYNNQKGAQSTDGRKKISGQATPKQVTYDELFPPLSGTSTVSTANNSSSSTQVTLYLILICFHRFIFQESTINIS